MKKLIVFQLSRQLNSDGIWLLVWCAYMSYLTHGFPRTLQALRWFSRIKTGIAYIVPLGGLMLGCSSLCFVRMKLRNAKFHCSEQ
ncbi:hypothetical protein PIB30_071358 [Stylosanthes scabra]|uniref:Uncharacterized protein n=1 Tax=Stylosanthes scabra TaxID=79078 RepID=A0ABU6ZMK4_9FABA|nr:hypothetical protein [Stylosanthes scabra]